MDGGIECACQLLAAGSCADCCRLHRYRGMAGSEQFGSVHLIIFVSRERRDGKSCAASMYFIRAKPSFGLTILSFAYCFCL